MRLHVHGSGNDFTKHHIGSPVFTFLLLSLVRTMWLNISLAIIRSNCVSSTLATANSAPCGRTHVWTKEKYLKHNQVGHTFDMVAMLLCFYGKTHRQPSSSVREEEGCRSLSFVRTV